MKKYLFLLLGICLSLSAHARLMTDQDAGVEFIESRNKTYFKADGTGTMEVFSHYRILTEEGVRGFNVFQLAFNANTQKITALKVAIKSDGAFQEIAPENIEEKSLFGGHSGYDETKTKIVPLPGVRVGSEITIAYTIESFHTSFPDTISHHATLNPGQNIGKLSMVFDFPEDTMVKLHDPAHYFTPFYKESVNNGRRIVSIDMVDAKGFGAINEGAEMPAQSQLAWIQATNKKTFAETGKAASIGFDEVLAKPLPEKLLSLFGPKPTTPLDNSAAEKRMLEILKAIAQNFRYFGDWRSVDGGFKPRPLADIAASGYGDCKDFSVLVTVAARHLGLEADPVIVLRGENPQVATPEIPNLDVYNHAIARVKSPDGKNDWWLDATNPIPNLGVIPFDISGRHALLLGKNAGEVTIGRDAPEESAQDISVTLDPSSFPDNSYNAEIILKGHVAWQVKKILFGKSAKEIEEYMIGFLGVSPYDARDIKVVESDFSGDLPPTIRYKMALKDNGGMEKSGDLKILPVMTFGDAHHRILGANPNDRHTDLSLLNLRQVKVSQKLKKNYTEVVGTPGSCNIKTPWLEYERKVETSPEFAVHDLYRVLANRITLEEIKTPQFAKLQNDLRDCIKQVRVVVK